MLTLFSCMFICRICSPSDPCLCPSPVHYWEQLEGDLYKARVQGRPPLDQPQTSNVFLNLNFIGDPRMHQCLITCQLPNDLCSTWHLWSELCLSPGTSRSDFRHYCQSRACPPARCKMRIDAMGVSKILVEFCASVLSHLNSFLQLAVSFRGCLFFEDGISRLESSKCGFWHATYTPPPLQAAPLNQWDLRWFHHHPPQW